MPVLEAMECSCPVICSATSSLPEVIEDCGYFFKPDDPASLNVQIKELLNDGDKRSEIITRGVNRASMFSWNKTAEMTLKGYTDLLNG